MGSEFANHVIGGEQTRRPRQVNVTFSELDRQVCAMCSRGALYVAAVKGELQGVVYARDCI